MDAVAGHCSGEQPRAMTAAAAIKRDRVMRPRGSVGGQANRGHGQKESHQVAAKSRLFDAREAG